MDDRYAEGRDGPYAETRGAIGHASNAVRRERAPLTAVQSETNDRLSQALGTAREIKGRLLGFSPEPVSAGRDAPRDMTLANQLQDTRELTTDLQQILVEILSGLSG